MARNLRDAIFASSYESKMPHHSKAVVSAYVAYSEELYKEQIATIPPRSRPDSTSRRSKSLLDQIFQRPTQLT